MARVVAASDVVITTAAVPGQKSPLLVTKQAVEGMAPGSVIVDLAAERGGNCEVTQAGQRVVHNGVTVLGPLNLPAEIPQHASQMYAKNISTFLLNLVKDKQVQLNLEDEIIRDTLIARDGQIVHARIQPLLKEGESIDRRKDNANNATYTLAAPGGDGPENGQLSPETTAFLTSLFTLMLATFIGLKVIKNVSRLLHTPLMSLTNAISAIAVVGSIVLAGQKAPSNLFTTILGAIALGAR